MAKSISASMLYNYVQCPHRVYMDVYEDPAKKDPESAFMRILWEMGTLFEDEVVRSLEIPFTDFKGKPGADRELLTREAMERGDSLIYGGRIRAGNLIGDPDLLRIKEKGYVAGDIKSGSGAEGGSDLSEGRPKKHYVVQVGLYTDILECRGISAGRTPFIWDVHGNEVTYDLAAPLGAKNSNTLWKFYEDCLSDVEGILNRGKSTTPAWASTCKLCHWRSVCLAKLKELDDLTLIPYLGRSKRDAMLGRINTVSELASLDITEFTDGNGTLFPRLGADKLKDFHLRARLQKERNAKPFIKKPLQLPSAACELFFDIETDPMRDICYLHGFVERFHRDRGTERYVLFFADEPTEEGERDVFSRALEYVQEHPGSVIYFYSKYERTWWLKLQERYPGVATREEVEAIFEPRRAVDLYSDVVLPCTDWPTLDYSIKSLAKYLGFRWRDTHPSGAESIEWYHNWVSSGDESIKHRILEYNEDDCIAMRVLLDALRDIHERESG